MSSPVKQKFLFNKLLKELFEEKILPPEESIDEGMAVLYSIISDMIKQNKYSDDNEYNSLIIDCGGGTTDVCSCIFKIVDIIFSCLKEEYIKLEKIIRGIIRTMKII